VCHCSILPSPPIRQAAHSSPEIPVPEEWVRSNMSSKAPQVSPALSTPFQLNTAGTPLNLGSKAYVLSIPLCMAPVVLKDHNNRIKRGFLHALSISSSGLCWQYTTFYMGRPSSQDWFLHSSVIHYILVSLAATQAIVLYKMLSICIQTSTLSSGSVTSHSQSFIHYIL
jgi:hypothetical protein